MGGLHTCRQQRNGPAAVMKWRILRSHNMRRRSWNGRFFGAWANYGRDPNRVDRRLKAMKITRIESIPIQVPIKPAVAIRSGRGGSHLASPFVLVRVHTDEGITGLGEVSCTPRWSGEDQTTAVHFINQYLAPLLEGENPTDIETLTLKFRLAVAGNYFTKAG